MSHVCCCDPPPAVPVEQVRALVRLLYPDEMTPTAARVIGAVCDAAERNEP